MSTISKTLGQRNVKIDVANVKNHIDSCSTVRSPVTSLLMFFYTWEIVSFDAPTLL